MFKTRLDHLHGMAENSPSASRILVWRVPFELLASILPRVKCINRPPSPYSNTCSAVPCALRFRSPSRLHLIRDHKWMFHTEVNASEPFSRDVWYIKAAMRAFNRFRLAVKGFLPVHPPPPSRSGTAPRIITWRKRVQ